MPTIIFQPSGRRQNVPAGTPLIDAIRAAGFPLSTPCGGKGTCGKCRVKILAGDVPADPRQKSGLAHGLLADGWRLACMTQVQDDLVVADPRGESGNGVILTDIVSREIVVDTGLWQVNLSMTPPAKTDQEDDLSRFLQALRQAGPTLPQIDLQWLQTLPEQLRRHKYNVGLTGIGDRLLALEGAGGEAGYGVGDRHGAPRHLGFAVDLGTTTIAGILCDLDNGAPIAVVSGPNPQAVRGDDVISRVDYAGKGAAERKEMRGLVVRALEGLAERARREAGLDLPILMLALGGNTVMNHLFLGVDATALAVSPFIPCFREAPALTADCLGWTGAAAPLVMIVPNIAAYVGGDITAGILAHEVTTRPGKRLFLDIGTNGEIVLSVDGKAYACAAAAGPAFEGARIRQGMRATEGALSVVNITRDGELEVEVVGGIVPARGLCGTGLLDAVAVLLKLGVIDEGGRMLDAEEARENGIAPHIVARIHENADGVAFWLVRPSGPDAPGVALTHRDVREFQLAKGAVAAGVRVLLDLAGVRPGAVDEVLLAGGFGNFLRPESALAVGLLPVGIELARVRSVGNAALAGTRLYLLSAGERERAVSMGRAVAYVELSGREDFQIAFAEEMLFPANA